MLCLMATDAELRARWDRRRARYGADIPLEARLRRARFRLEAAKVERAWAVVSAHRDGLSVRKIADAVGLSPTRMHQVLASPEAAGWEARLDMLRAHGWPAPEDPPADTPSSDMVGDRLADEAQALRDVTDWLDNFVYALFETDEAFRASWRCRCGTENCRGTVTGRDWQLADLQARYVGHFSPLLEKRIARQRCCLQVANK